MSVHSSPSFKTSLIVLLSLFVLTLLTVGVAQIDFGLFNAFIAMLIASLKGTLVLMYFMQLKYDEKIYTIIFGSSVFFLFVFYFFSQFDIITRVIQNSVL